MPHPPSRPPIPRCHAPLTRQCPFLARSALWERPFYGRWPLLSFIGTKLEPGWLWFSTNVYDFHHIAFMFENLTAVNTTNASISTKVRFNDTSFLNQDPMKQNIFNDPFNENLHDD